MSPDPHDIFRDFNFDFKENIDDILIFLLTTSIQTTARVNALYDFFPQIASSALQKDQEYVEQKLEEVTKQHEASMIALVVQKWGKVRDQDGDTFLKIPE